MRLANRNDEIEAQGAEVIGLSVDSAARSAALARRWHLPFKLVSDPGGERFLQRLELWNPDERDGIAWPALVLIAPDGEEVARVRSHDFADRTHDDDVLKVLRENAYPAIDAEAWSPTDVPEEGSDALSGAFSVEMFKPLMNGNRFGAIALSQRIEHEPSRRIAQEHATMAKSFVEAWSQRKRETE